MPDTPILCLSIDNPKGVNLNEQVFETGGKYIFGISAQKERNREF